MSRIPKSIESAVAELKRTINQHLDAVYDEGHGAGWAAAMKEVAKIKAEFKRKGKL